MRGRKGRRKTQRVCWTREDRKIRRIDDVLAYDKSAAIAPLPKPLTSTKAKLSLCGAVSQSFELPYRVRVEVPTDRDQCCCDCSAIGRFARLFV